MREIFNSSLTGWFAKTKTIITVQCAPGATADLTYKARGGVITIPVTNNTKLVLNPLESASIAGDAFLTVLELEPENQLEATAIKSKAHGLTDKSVQFKFRTDTSPGDIYDSDFRLFFNNKLPFFLQSPIDAEGLPNILMNGGIFPAASNFDEVLSINQSIYQKYLDHRENFLVAGVEATAICFSQNYVYVGGQNGEIWIKDYRDDNAEWIILDDFIQNNQSENKKIRITAIGLFSTLEFEGSDGETEEDVVLVAYYLESSDYPWVALIRGTTMANNGLPVKAMTGITRYAPEVVLDSDGNLDIDHYLIPSRQDYQPDIIQAGLNYVRRPIINQYATKNTRIVDIQNEFLYFSNGIICDVSGALTPLDLTHPNNSYQNVGFEAKDDDRLPCVGRFAQFFNINCKDFLVEFGLNSRYSSMNTRYLNTRLHAYWEGRNNNGQFHYNNPYIQRIFHNNKFLRGLFILPMGAIFYVTPQDSTGGVHNFLPTQRLVENGSGGNPVWEKYPWVPEEDNPPFRPRIKEFDRDAQDLTLFYTYPDARVDVVDVPLGENFLYPTGWAYPLTLHATDPLSELHSVWDFTLAGGGVAYRKDGQFGDVRVKPCAVGWLNTTNEAAIWTPDFAPAPIMITYEQIFGRGGKSKIWAIASRRYFVNPDWKFEYCVISDNGIAAKSADLSTWVSNDISEVLGSDSIRSIEYIPGTYDILDIGLNLPEIDIYQGFYLAVGTNGTILMGDGLQWSRISLDIKSRNYNRIKAKTWSVEINNGADIEYYTTCFILGDSGVLNELTFKTAKVAAN